MASKDMLAQIVRAIVGVDVNHHGVLLDITNKLGGDNAAAYRKRFGEVLRESLAGIESSTTPVIAFNEHGHLTVTFVGLDLSGAEEIVRAQKQGNRVDDYAQSCLLSTKPDSYDANHRLVAGQVYTAVLMPNSVIPKDRDRTTENLRKTGFARFGYKKPLAGIAPRIREYVSDEKLKELDFWYAATLHDPIPGRDGPRLLNALRFDDGRWLGTCWEGPGRTWRVGGAFVLLVPAS